MKRLFFGILCFFVATFVFSQQTEYYKTKLAVAAQSGISALVLNKLTATLNAALDGLNANTLTINAVEFSKGFKRLLLVKFLLKNSLLLSAFL